MNHARRSPAMLISAKIVIWLSALAGYAGCILMPLAGRAGAATAHAGANRLVLTAVWAAGASLAVAGWRHMRKTGGSRGWIPAALAGVQTLCLILLWTGLFGK